MATTFNTLHIFGFGDVQVITKDGGKTKKAKNLTTLQAVIDNIWSKKPADNNISSKDYHAINIFNDMFADWQSKIKGEKNYRTKYDELNYQLIETLVAEVLA
jgi:hypothetical protein